NRSVTNEKLGRLEEQYKDSSAAINIDKRFANAYFKRANVYKEIADLKNAISDYQKVIENETVCSQNYIDANFNIAYIYNLLNNSNKAVEYYKKCADCGDYESSELIISILNGNKPTLLNELHLIHSSGFYLLKKSHIRNFFKVAIQTRLESGRLDSSLIKVGIPNKLIKCIKKDTPWLYNNLDAISKGESRPFLKVPAEWRYTVYDAWISAESMLSIYGRFFDLAR
ncbi:hypothetical protein MHK_000433, partial [Candidatus Magnetomorum sp. HK-1]